MLQLLIVLYCEPTLTFPINQCAKAVEGEQFEVSQTLGVCPNFHSLVVLKVPLGSLDFSKISESD